MASTPRTWIISAAAASGVVAGGAVGLAAAAPAHGTPAKPAAPQRTAVDTTTLSQQVQELLAEDRALHLALAQAKSRLSSQVASSEASLRAVRTQLAAAQAALAAARRAAATSQQSAAVAPAARPSSHTSTGASGATNTDDGGHDD